MVKLFYALGSKLFVKHNLITNTKLLWNNIILIPSLLSNRMNTTNYQYVEFKFLIFLTSIL